MTLLDGLATAIRALRTNLMRSFLTTLGIVIGIFSVVVMVSLGASARHAIDEQIANFGAQMLMVYPGSSNVGGRAGGAGTNLPMSETDLRALEQKVAGVTAISGQLYQSLSVVRGNANWTTLILAGHEGFFAARNYRLADGRPYSDADVRSASRVAVLGATVVKKLYPEGDDPVGTNIRIKDVAYTVIGVLEAKGSAFGNDQDDVILVPITAARGRIITRKDGSPNPVGTIFVKFADNVDLKSAEEQIEGVLRQTRRIPDAAERNFIIQDLREMLRTQTQIVAVLSYLLAGTAAVSLIVGGVGIMNIMLVSVTERTREIGLRMAVGGRRRDILRQFLIEAVTLCLLGGAFGIVLAKAAVSVTSAASGWPLFIPLSAVAMALLVATSTGVSCGYFPARRAARLNPIEALRSE